MVKRLVFVCFLFAVLGSQAQVTSSDFRSKKIIATKDTIRFDSVPINPQKFKVLDDNLNIIRPSNYEVIYNEALLIINSNIYQEITVEYFRFPSFLTETFSPLDKSLIVPNNTNTGKLYSLTTNKKVSEIKLFDGLKTSGFITRGVTTGNNQNTVTNASMDLTLEGNLSKTVGIRANIFDTNLPLQENGYSQSITDFDRIFIELFHKDWRVRAGDVNLKNDETFFLNFEKQVAGVEVEVDVDSINVLVSGAVVRGQFSVFNFVGVESNQGPYKIFGPNNEPNIVIVGGSDRVFVNGVPIERGEDKDYIIDYNIGEIRFNTSYPITNDMRIRIEFQYTERNYTRFITYNKGIYQGKNWNIGGFFYNENDAKNAPIQVNLTNDQKEILAAAGNNRDLMVATSAFEDVFGENKILYRKVQQGTQEIFEYSTDPDETLFNVNFTNVGSNNGSYVIDDTLAIGNIFRFVGPSSGDYEPIVQLIAPTKLQVAAVKSEINPSQKTSINAELSVSNNDQNLFSEIDDDQNKGLASELEWKQTILDKKWKVQSRIYHQFVHQNFSTVQRFQSVEFNRDWNITNATGNLQQLQAGISLQRKDSSYINYEFRNLQFGNNFRGNKHVFQSMLKFKNTYVLTKNSFLNNNSDVLEYSFLRSKFKVEHSFKKSWLGAYTDVERNEGKEKLTGNQLGINHQYQEYEGYFGIGDSTKVYAKVGFNYRTNDSIRNNAFTQINNRKTFYTRATLVQNKRTNLSVYANYRITQNFNSADEKALNSRISYNQKFFNQFLSLGTLYESSSGNVAQQDFVYVETEPGQGFYSWIDYNNDGIQQFDEFEIAQFQDQANFLRLPLPNLRFLPTQRAKWSQSIILNPNQWRAKEGWKKLLSKFYNQTFLSIDNEQERQDNAFNLNPFALNDDKQISLLYNFRNSIFFNRNLQRFSTSYTFINSRAKQQLIIGSQENKNRVHQLEFQHKLSQLWLFRMNAEVSENELITENLANRNFIVNGHQVSPSIQYVLDSNNRFSLSYFWIQKENQVSAFESLQQHKLEAEYFLLGKKKQQFQANITAFSNTFSGNPNTPVGFQMLEGFQDGTNFSWRVLWNQKLNSFLNLNLSYQGRKSENARAIHTGTIQLRAIF